jgi:OHCU decarboxylase
MSRLAIAEVNAMDRAAFVARFGEVYEHSPWVAEQAWDARPFTDRAALENAMQAVMLKAGRERQLEVIRSHPRLGTRRPITSYSQSEQQGAGITSASDADREELRRLNSAYEAKFGLPFILAVRHANLRTILDSCRARIEHDAGQEFDESLRQVGTIARFRLSDLVEEGQPETR